MLFFNVDILPPTHLKQEWWPKAVMRSEKIHAELCASDFERGRDLEECPGDYPTGHRFYLWVGGLIRAAIGDNHVFISIDIE